MYGQPDEQDLHEARLRLEEFCDENGGSFNAGAMNTNKQYECQMDDYNVSLHAQKKPSPNRHTGEIEVVERFDVEIEVETGGVEVDDAIFADAHSIKERTYRTGLNIWRNRNSSPVVIGERR